VCVVCYMPRTCAVARARLRVCVCARACVSERARTRACACLCVRARARCILRLRCVLNDTLAVCRFVSTITATTAPCTPSLPVAVQAQLCPVLQRVATRQDHHGNVRPRFLLSLCQHGVDPPPLYFVTEVIAL
jgi:hypothetical protein